MPARRTRATSRTGPRSPAAELTGKHDIDTGVVEIRPDNDEPGGWFVDVNGVPSSYVHLDDPTALVFEYVQWIGDLLDIMAEPEQPLAVLHLGGAGCTLARYVAATRPGSVQVVYEIDAALVELMREAFDLRRRSGVRLRTGDARQGMAELPDDSRDVVIRDAFDCASVPPHLTTVEYAAEVARVLRPNGVYVANVADKAEQALARAEAATLREVFGQVAMVAEPGQLRGRRYGNVLLLASATALPLDALTRRLASGVVRARVVPSERVAELVAGIRPSHDPPS